MTDRLNDQPEYALHQFLNTAGLMDDVPDIDPAFAARLELRVVAAARTLSPTSRRRSLARISGIASLAAVLLLMFGLASVVIDGSDRRTPSLVSAPTSASCEEFAMFTPDLTALANATFVPAVATPRDPFDTIQRFAVRYFPEPGSTSDPILTAFVSQLRSCIQAGYNPMALKQFGSTAFSRLTNLYTTNGASWAVIDQWRRLVHQPITQTEKEHYLAALDGAMLFRAFPSGSLYIAFPAAGNDSYWPGYAISSLEASSRSANDAQATDHFYADGPIVISNNPKDSVYADIPLTDPSVVLLPWEIMPASLLDATPLPAVSAS